MDRWVNDSQDAGKQSTGVKEAGEGSLAEAREDFFLRDGQNLL